MTDQQIRCFLAVSRTLSFTRAAEELYVSQPATSRLIAALEKELSVQLFDRSGSTIRLTEAGSLLYEFFDASMNELNGILRKAQETDPLYANRLHLGILSGWSISNFLVPLSKRFSQLKPAIEFTVESRDFPNLVAGLYDRSLDAAVALDLVPELFHDLEMRQIAEPREILLCSVKNPVAALPDPTPWDFRNEIFWVPPALTDAKISTMDEVRRILLPYHFEPILKSVKNWETMMEYIANGLGVCINITWARECSNSSFRHIELNSRHPINIAWHKKCSNPSLSLLIQEISRLFPTSPGTM